ncbi:MAG: phosphohydrolase, partial [Candidatus Woesearchaeota archaeon]
TKIEPKQIIENFGEDVYFLVNSHTENKNLSWEERKANTIKHLKTASYEEQLITCADKLSNIRSIKQDLDKLGNKVWERFNRGYEKQKWYYENLKLSLSLVENTEMYKEFSTLVNLVFNK